MRISDRAWIELLALAAIWGAAFMAVEVALRELGPLTIVFWRVTLGALLLWGVVWVRRLHVPRSARFWGACLGMGVLNNALPFALIAWGQREVESGLAAILNGAATVFGVLVATSVLSEEKLTAGRAVGVGLGLAGLACAMGPGALGSFDARSLAQLAVLGGALSYACASVWARLTLVDQPPIVAAAGMTTLASGLVAGPMLALEGAPSLALRGSTWLAIGYCAGLGTAVGYLLYYRVLESAGAANLTLVSLLKPPVAILLGWALLDERLGWTQLGGFLILALGMVVLDGRLLGRWVSHHKGDGEGLANNGPPAST